MTDKQEISTSSQVLIFTIGEEEYGIDIKKVQEIRGREAVTAIPGARDCQKGVINLRGIIVPIIDLRIRFQMSEVTFDDLTTFIIVTVQNRLVGVIVDRVSDVVTLTSDQIKPLSTVTGSFARSSVTGVGTVDERMILLLDIEEVVGSIEMLETDVVPD